MKLETAAIITRGLCYSVIGGLTPLASALAQWANSGEWPPNIVWVVIVSSCIVGASTQMLSFLSGSYSKYEQARRDENNSSTNTVTK